MSLVTRCPKCQSDFIVSLEQLRVHQGLVRCGSCTHIFDGHAALESRVPVLTQRAANSGEALASSGENLAPAAQTVARGDEHTFSPPMRRESGPEQRSSPNRAPNRLPAQASAQAPSAPSVLRRRAQTGAELEPEPAEPFVALQPEASFYQAPWPEREPLFGREPTFGQSPTVHREPTHEHEPKFGHSPIAQRAANHERESALRVQGEARLRGGSRLAAGRGTPDFLIDETPLDGLRRGLWTLLAVLAGALLLLQLMYVYRNELVTRVPSLLPMARAACIQLKCEVSFVRQLERITIDSTALEQLTPGQAEGQASSLTLKFSMRNRLDKIQPWPHLSVELKDSSGTPVLRKVLAPESYLPESMVARPFGAQQEVHLSVPLVVNGLQISGVQLNRFFP
jgi:predicted Zn finger-like uncharacterized protein